MYKSNIVKKKNSIEGESVVIKPLYLKYSDDKNALELSAQLELEGHEVHLFTELNELLGACKKESPNVVILDVVFESDEIVDVDTINKIKKLLASSSSLIFVANQNDFGSRLKMATAGANRTFSLPLDSDKLIRSVNSLITSLQKAEFRVMLIDDTGDLKEYAIVLSDTDMYVEVLNKPLDCLTAIAGFQPDIILTTEKLSACSGHELAKVIRQDDNWVFTPIIFLTSVDNKDNEQGPLCLQDDDVTLNVVKPENLPGMLLAKIKQVRKSNRINKALAESLLDNKYRLKVLDAHDIVSTADIAGRITSVNARFCEISGYPRDELIGQNHRILKSNYHPDSFYVDLWKTISSGNIWQGTICNRRKDGTEYWVESTIVPFLNDAGKPYKYVSARTDITALRQSEERLNRSQTYANIGTWDWDITSGALFWSDRIAPLFGYEKDTVETSYDNFLSAVHPDDRQSVSDAVSDCVAHGKDYNIEHRIVWPDGTIRWVQESGDVTRGVDGAPLHMLGVVQDITERRLATIRLYETEKHNQLLLESIGEGIYGLDKDGVTIFINPAACQILGYLAEELVGKQMHALIHHSYPDGSEYPKNKCRMLAAYHDDTIYTVDDEVFWCKDGSSLPVEYTSTPIRNEGKVVGAVVTFRDISERIKSEHALLSAKEEAESANHAKSQFLASMSHELRTPMNAIMGFGQLLKLDEENILGESQEENVDEILSASEHLLELINEVLDLSKIEEGQLDLSLESIVFSGVLGESIQLMTPLADKRGIKIKVIRHGEELSFEELLEQTRTVIADRVRLKQVLLNLISNAVKYNSVGGEITICCHPVVDGIARIDIADTGNGLSLEQQAQLFKPFNRLGVEQTDIEGIGIGLVITKKIIELMGGRIGVDSIPGEGCTFWFELASETPSVEDENKNYANKSNGGSQSDNSTDKDYTILYVEDNPANLRLVEQILTRQPDVELLSAPEPLLGLELAVEYKPDLILLDINLSGMDGYEVLKKLRQHKDTTDITVVAISANAMPKDIDKGMKAGFDDYITKPIDVNNFLNVINKKLS